MFYFSLSRAQQDPSNSWPGLISMPNHVFLGRRLKALVAKFRDEKRQALREAEKAKEAKRCGDMATHNDACVSSL